jgi:hypothetical protein
MKTIEKLLEDIQENAKSYLTSFDLKYFDSEFKKMNTTLFCGISGVLTKLEQVLKMQGFTLGDIQHDDFEKDGEEDFFIINYRTSDIAKNAVIYIKWESIPPVINMYDREGFNLNTSVVLELVSLDESEIAEILNDVMEDGIE